ncbi:MAG: GAF domain-containing protein [Actinobacteria bacterium]|nr:GAF domain-containing protein [Actinomycetota bacterium]
MTTAEEQRQLNRLLTALVGARDEHEGLVAALPAIASMLRSDAALVWAGGEVRHRFGDIEAAALDRRAGGVELEGRRGAAAPLLDDGYLLVARPGSPYDAGDLETLIGFASALDLFLRMWRARTSERLSTERGHRQAVENVRLLDSLIERQRLFERLTRIQRSISHRAPLQEVLDAVCLGARELIGDEVVGVRLIDPDDPDVIEVKADVGLSDEMREKVRRSPSGVGVGGRAFKENRLVIVYEYDRSDNVVVPLKEGGLQSAMAAPVHEHGQPVGSLVISTFKRGRRYSQVEQEVLLAFAEHVSIALTDAKTVEALREAQRVKEMFLAMVSHELKTPLTAIMGTLKTFQKHDSALRGELRDSMLDSAVDRGDQLAHLINRLLIGARAELANIEQDITLQDLVANSVKGFRDMGILDIQEVPDLTVRTDAGSIQGALGILLENAIAHSPTGSSIVVRTSVTDTEISIAVINEGGLPDELDAGALFQPFQRGAEARSSGVGLGLYIALRLAEASGGTIEVASVDNQVTFDVRVPLKPARDSVS